MKFDVQKTLTFLKQHKFYLIIFLGLMLALLIWRIFTPSSYEECMLKNIKDTPVEAYSFIDDLCRDKFPEKIESHNSRELKQNELAAVTGRAGPSYQGSTRFEVNLYNGAPLNITEVEIGIGWVKKVDAIKNKDDVFSGPYTAYRKTVSIPTKTAATFTFDFVPADKGAEIHWRVISAKGY